MSGKDIEKLFKEWVGWWGSIREQLKEGKNRIKYAVYDSKKISVKNMWGLDTGEMAQQLRALTALPEVLSSNPSNYMVDHNYL